VILLVHRIIELDIRHHTPLGDAKLAPSRLGIADGRNVLAQSGGQVDLVTLLLVRCSDFSH
jgi:hypothetical protein